MMVTDRVNSLLHGRSRTPARWPRRSSGRSKLYGFEVLESRQLLATFLVTNLNASGSGSLRQAIIDSNKRPGADAIDFETTGTIRVGRTPLPAITGPVTIDGSTAPSFAGSPVVTVDFQGSSGFRFEKGANGSILRSLSLVRAGNAAVTLTASDVTVQGNYIGLLANGKTVAGNCGDGIRIDAPSQGDVIGQSDPASGISYYNADSVSMQPVSGWQGIRDSSASGQYLIAGTSDDNGLLYEGPITGAGGTSYSVNYPGATATSVYGPDIVSGDVLRLVGSYRNDEGVVNGFVFQGTTADLSQSSDYQTIDYPGAQYTYVHSTMGDIAVGNADGPEGNAPIGTGHAFVYSVSQSQILTDIVYPGSTSTTAYGIWYNGGTSYTICGGFTMLGSAGKTIAEGYLVYYDSATGQFTNWTSYADPNGLAGQAFATHFQGISSPEPGVYTLSANSAEAGSSTVLQAEFVTVELNPDGTFGSASWVNLSYPGGVGSTTANSVAGNQVVGIVPVSTGIISYQATVDEFQLSNVISGNRGNGIGIYGSSDNQIAMNFIGTDASGTLKRGNGENGILVTQGATDNMIGGQATGGNDPTAGVFVRPPQGNLISGNRGDGVLIMCGASQNTMSGNFVGTTASGDAALGNCQDGVAIVGANGNQLIGCTSQDEPFVYYNVLSGNRGNGLRITRSNDTTVQANFMGAGANNAAIVANHGDGLLVSGNSSDTQVGGVIPLGNVISGNDRNGIEVSDTASSFTSFNTFAGTFAFAGAAPNKRDGILITSTGGNNLIRTCIVSGNLGNGIELGGQASGVQVTDTAVGTNSDIQTAIPNGGDGIKIDGHAHGNSVGGFQPSIEPQVTISANRGYGIAIAGDAHDNSVFHTYIGTNAQGTANLGNALGGISIGPGTSSSTIGGSLSALQNNIFYSGGPGVTVRSSRDNAVLGNEIQGGAEYGVYVTGVVTGTKVQDNAISGNATDGVALVRARRVTIGGDPSGAGSQIVADPGNRIVTNQGYGLYARGACNGSVVQGNTIVANAQGNVNITNSRGITYMSDT
jgi:trimeric autotransporter adhesin